MSEVSKLFFGAVILIGILSGMFYTYGGFADAYGISYNETTVNDSGYQSILEGMQENVLGDEIDKETDWYNLFGVYSAIRSFTKTTSFVVLKVIPYQLSEALNLPKWASTMLITFLIGLLIVSVMSILWRYKV